MNNRKRKWNVFKQILLSLLILAFFIVPASANGIADSTFGVGLKRFLEDVFGFLTILCPIAGAASAIYFVIRRGMSDDQDGKLWERRIKIAILCGVGGGLISGLITVLASYF